MENLTNKELRSIATEQGIDLTGARTKGEIIARINSLKEDKTMNEEMNVQAEAEAIEEVTEEVVYHLDDGTECSRSAYIRQEFQKDRSRQDICKELGLKYYIVYSATANMFNAAHPKSGSGVSGHGSIAVPRVNAKFEYIDGEGNVVATEEEAATIPRAELMRELATAGLDRSALKDYFKVPYATVYAATKEVFNTGEGSSRTRKTVTDPETGEEINRSDYIRSLYQDGEGMTRREIAKQLTDMTGELVDYATVWAATKPAKEEEVEEVEVEEEVEDVE